MDDYASPVMLGLRDALLADPRVAALVGDRVLDEPAEDVAFPYVRFGLITPQADDTCDTLGAIVTVGLEAHSRPVAGRVEAQAICGAMSKALHRKPDLVTVEGFTVTEIEVQTWAAARAGDGASYIGTLALQVHLDA